MVRGRTWGGFDRSRVRAWQWAGLVALGVPVLSCGSGASMQDPSYVEDADPMALTWVAPTSTDGIEVEAPADLVVTTQNPDARVVTFEVDGAPAGTCDPSDPDADCRDGALWRWTVSFSTAGHHTLAASFVAADGHSVRAETSVDVVTMLPDPVVEEGMDGQADPMADNEVEDGTSTIVDGITDARGFLDPNKPLHNACNGIEWSVQAQRVLLARGRIDGSTEAIARCVQRYDTSVRRYADRFYISRASVYAAMTAAGDCTANGWTANLITAAQCAALVPTLTPSACAQRMRTTPDFAIEVSVRYLAGKSQRARHHNDPPKEAAILATGGAYACSNANPWHLLAKADYISRFVGAYNAYRTREAVTNPATPPARVPNAIAFEMHPNVVLAQSFTGFGAQYNQNLYSAFNAMQHPGINDQTLATLAPALADLGPRHVRIFFASQAFGDSDLMQSFQRTVRLAQDSGATVNVTYWHGPYPDATSEMNAFAQVLADLRTAGITAVQYVTIQNEVNSTRVTYALYEQLYRALDRALQDRGIRDTIHFVGGDLLRDGEQGWFGYMAAHMADILDGYSVHIYWDVQHPEYLFTRLSEVRKIVDALPASQRRPLYVTEYGVRGNRDHAPDPGVDPQGRPIAEGALTAFQHGLFDVFSTRLGYVGLVKWDAYISAYDRGVQDYALLGTPSSGWERRPAFFVSQLVSHAARPGMQVVRVDGGGTTAMVSALRDGAGDVTLLAVNDAPATRFFRVAGVPNTAFQRASWSMAASHEIGRGTVQSSGGVVQVGLPPHSVMALTTFDPGL